MPDMFDYLTWRGDLTFSQCPVTSADALILSTLSYIQFGAQVTDDPIRPIFLHTAVDGFFALQDYDKRVRDKRDLELLLAAAESPRFRNVGLCFYRDELLPEEESQFAAMTFLLDDGTAFLAFRGTDYSLVGWKEDFNMSFRDTVPAQHKAAAYTREFAAAFSGPMYLGGHSKGGNLAVFSAARADAETRDRIRAVYNLDGPGFGDYLMGDPGYLAMVPKIRTFIPQSSIIGMLLEHEEDYTVIRSRQVSLMQHEPYSWEIQGPGFLETDDISPDTRFLDRTIKHWLSGMTSQERGEFVDTVFDLLSQGDASKTYHLLRPQNLRTYFRALSGDDNLRRILSEELARLVESARTQAEPEELPALPEE